MAQLETLLLSIPKEWSNNEQDGQYVAAAPGMCVSTGLNRNKAQGYVNRDVSEPNILLSTYKRVTPVIERNALS